MWDVEDPARYAAMLATPHEIRPTLVSTLGGDLIDEIVPTSWQITTALRDKQTESKLELVCLDPDGILLTDDPGSALPAAGQQISLQVTVEASGWLETMPMGRWRIQESTPSGGRWRLYPNGTWRRGGSAVTTSCEDLLSLIADHDFVGKSAPPTDATTITEVARLLEAGLPVDLGTLVSGPVARTPWEGTRLDAVVALIADIGGITHIDRSGVLTGIPVAGTGHIHDIRAAEVTGYVEGVATGLIDWTPRATRDGVINAIALTGQRADGATLYAEAYEDTGPLAYDAAGYGRVVLREHNAQLTTQAAVDAAAPKRLAELAATRTQTLDVTIMPNPAIDILDTARILLPGAERTIEGLIVGHTIGSHGPMQLQVSVPYGALTLNG